MATAEQIEAYEKATGADMFAASDKRDAALDARFAEHVARAKGALGLQESFHNPERRPHVSASDGESVASDTRIFWGENLSPVLVGIVLREENHILLTVVDRSGPTPVVYEDRFDSPDFI